jgi:hypothetical protein
MMKASYVMCYRHGFVSDEHLLQLILYTQLFIEKASVCLPELENLAKVPLWRILR